MHPPRLLLYVIQNHATLFVISGVPEFLQRKPFVLIDSGAEFYDYDAKYLTETSKAYIPARIPAEVEEVVRETAVKVYNAVGCQGLSRVDFFVTHDENRVVFNEINTLPGFTSISMYPKLFEASGIPYSQLIDELLRLAVEAFR